MGRAVASAERSRGRPGRPARGSDISLEVPPSPGVIWVRLWAAREICVRQRSLSSSKSEMEVGAGVSKAFVQGTQQIKSQVLWPFLLKTRSQSAEGA